MSQSQLQNLLAQKKYRQAIEEIKTLRRSQPDLVTSPTEAEIWSLRGQQELENKDFKAAENSFRQSLKLGLTLYYGLAKALLDQNRPDVALGLVGKAFEDKTLSKEEGICYLKLLLIKDDRTTLETLIKEQSKRFTAGQLHWAKGVLALKSGDPKAALTAFNKLKKTPLTSGECPDAWLVYSHQQAGAWEAASAKLGFVGQFTNGRFTAARFARPNFSKHPAITKLMLLQQATVGDVRQPIIPSTDRTSKEFFDALDAVQLMAEGNIHDAGHAILKLRAASPRFKPLLALKPKILALAGQQAQTQGMNDCAYALWQPILHEKDLDPQLMVNLLMVLAAEDEYQDFQRLITRLIKWIEAEAKRNPSTWPEVRLKRTLAEAHCLLGDSWLALGRHNAAFGAVEQAARICPTSPEVIGRKGLIAYDGGDQAEGLVLLTQALEQGCHSEDVYERLQDGLRQAGRKDDLFALRKRYGPAFGDLNVEEEIEIEPWIEALAMEDYETFVDMLPESPSTDPPIRACQIFRDAAYGKPTASGKISIRQDQVIKAWDQALAKLPPIDRVKMLQAIALCLLVLSKRDKGIAALVTRYQSEILPFIPTVPEAQVIHLIVTAFKESNPQKLQVHLKPYLDAQPQPGQALAQLQLQVRWFGQTANLRTFLDKALGREPQNPLLLLAKATTFSLDSQPYEQLHKQGFELARQLQDAQALQAYRVEDYYVGEQEGMEMMPSFGMPSFDMPSFGMPSFGDDDDSLFADMVRKTLGNKVPPGQLEQLIPLLKMKFLEEALGGGPGGFGMDVLEEMFGGSGPRKRKQNFMDL
ncbi:MAG: tetratricopeptide repeat protein [Alkalinema sp. RU_4_3]|nr:tetratricopeptide repeat protein [Alkalinema sp. RU_4_3]